jgi:hypothetical protein
MNIIFRYFMKNRAENIDIDRVPRENSIDGQSYRYLYLYLSHHTTIAAVALSLSLVILSGSIVMASYSLSKSILRLKETPTCMYQEIVTGSIQSLADNMETVEFITERIGKILAQGFMDGSNSKSKLLKWLMQSLAGAEILIYLSSHAS